MMPDFQGGYQALDEQIRVLKQPAALRPPVNTYVQVECIVEPTGQLTFPHILEGLGPSYDEEALRIVRLLPPFEPAIGCPTETRALQPLALRKGAIDFLLLLAPSLTWFNCPWNRRNNRFCFLYANRSTY
ncbi:energy transducer TonB [Hymenobacter negativus]|nr:energy transducer TonB [Hymenobacter negativus]